MLEKAFIMLLAPCLPTLTPILPVTISVEASPITQPPLETTNHEKNADDSYTRPLDAPYNHYPLNKPQTLTGTLLFKDRAGKWTLPTEPSRNIQSTADTFSSRLFRSKDPEHDGKFLLLLSDPRIQYGEKSGHIIDEANALFSISDLVLFYNRDRVIYNHVLMGLFDFQDLLPKHIQGLLTYQPALAQEFFVRLADIVVKADMLVRLFPFLALIGISLFTGYTFQDNAKEMIIIMSLLLLSSYWLNPATKSLLYTPDEADSNAGNQITRLVRKLEDIPIRNSISHYWNERSKPGLVTVILPVHHTVTNIQERMMQDLNLAEIDLTSL